MEADLLFRQWAFSQGRCLQQGPNPIYKSGSVIGRETGHEQTMVTTCSLGSVVDGVVLRSQENQADLQCGQNISCTPDFLTKIEFVAGSRASTGKGAGAKRPILLNSEQSDRSSS